MLALNFPAVTQFADILTGHQRRIFNWQRTKIFMEFLTAIKISKYKYLCSFCSPLRTSFILYQIIDPQLA